MAFPSAAGLRVNSLVLAFSLVAGKFVLLRLFTRLVLLQKAGLDDLFIGLAMLFAIGLTTTIAVQITKGLGRHIDMVTESEATGFLQAFWASAWTYYLALFATKLSIITQYFKLFPTRRFRIICYLLLTVIISFGLWSIFGSIFLCFPVNNYWNRSAEPGTCANRRAVSFTNAGLNIGQDIILLLLPIVVFRRLAISKNQKRGLMLVFGLGGVVCLVSAARLYSLVAIADAKDPTFSNTFTAALSAVEVDIGIVTTCLPTLRPLLAATMPKYFQRDGQHCCNCGGHTHPPPPQQQPEKAQHSSTNSWPYATLPTSRMSWDEPVDIEKPGHGHPGLQISAPAPAQENWRNQQLRPGSNFSRQDLEVPIFLWRTPTMRNSPSQNDHQNRRQSASSSLSQRMHPLRMSPPSPQKTLESATEAEAQERQQEQERERGQAKPTTHARWEEITSPAPLYPEPLYFKSKSGHTQFQSRPLVFHKPLPITPFPLTTGP